MMMMMMSLNQNATPLSKLEIKKCGKHLRCELDIKGRLFKRSLDSVYASRRLTLV